MLISEAELGLGLVGLGRLTEFAAMTLWDHDGSRTARHPRSPAAIDTAALACPRSCWQ